MHKAITGFIVKSTLLGEVIESMNFDDKFFFSAIEFDCIDAYRMLPSEFLVAPASITKQLPKQLFVSVLTLPQVSSDLFLVHRLIAVLPTQFSTRAPHPPAPSPRSTEEKGRHEFRQKPYSN